MKVRRLQLEDMQLARISVETKMARLSIDSPVRRIKSVSQATARMTVKRENPSLTVASEISSGSAEPVRVVTPVQQSVVSAHPAAISQSPAGSQAAASLRKTNPIIHISRNTASKIGQSAVRQSVQRPVLKGQPGSFSINWKFQDVTISWDDYQAPVITVEPKASVNVYLATEPHLEFKVIEQSFPPEMGQAIDEEA
ncbi:DUF6470 family protein [Oscillospiraceae bacterium WX1]